ncbi:MAG: sugar transferase [Verrucomicrobia bacterium]|nr:sugar transferase [Verrucomicrobiota bacterium]
MPRKRQGWTSGFAQWPRLAAGTFRGGRACPGNGARASGAEAASDRGRLWVPGWKRGIDLLCCVVGIPLFAIVTLGWALVLRLSSPGPLLFRQERVGRLGVRFQIFKFRTMQHSGGANKHRQHMTRMIENNAPMHKLDTTGDSRLIPGGWLLRALGLDEIPQLVNVWRGEMSIVGPRPCIPYEYEYYTEIQRERFHGVPGLTGLWQVSGKNRTTFEEMIHLDREYLRRQCLLLDLWIIVLTIPALCVQLGDTLRSRLCR